MTEVVTPFTKMAKEDKNKRVNEAMGIICTQTDRDYVNEVSGKNETNELYRSWLDISFSLERLSSVRCLHFVANFLF